ncbi:Hypothetical Protein RRSL_02978 [Ralstonia solanacearum UW551]|uniref:Uncharacterized protein n=1 Tax=Ralstonia solanacearum (strain UW551) TaxID=342110 RepID=A0AB33VEM7_RALSU|nr:Hypothetical Protein RRSL_02978 [Ralstonia solanacearum UW551]
MLAAASTHAATRTHCPGVLMTSAKPAAIPSCDAPSARWPARKPYSPSPCWSRPQPLPHRMRKWCRTWLGTLGNR